MSSFSSVVQKPGKKFVPKAVPRRTLPRKPTSSIASATVSSAPEEYISDHSQSTATNSVTAGSTELQNEQSVRPSEGLSRAIPTPDEAATTEHTAALRPSIEALSSEDTTTTTPANNSSNIPEGQPVTDVRSYPTEQPATPPSTVEVVAVQPDSSSQVLTQGESLAGSSGIDVTQGEELVDGVNAPELRSTKRKKAHNQTDASLSPRKRRKTTPRATSEHALSPPIPITPPTATTTANRSPDEQRHSRNQPTDDLLLSATQRAASVSELASDIESQTRLLRPQTEPSATNTDQTESSDERQTGVSTSLSKPKRTKRKKTAQEQAVEVIASALGKGPASGRQRAETPENAESHELEPAKVTMGELCEDNKLGKKSTLETEMQENWAEILQRRKEDRERALLNAEKHRRKGFGQRNRILDNTQEPAAVIAPAMTVINGVIVVDQASREIDRSAQLQQAAAQDLDNVREDRDYYKYVNQATVGIKPGRGQHSKWDEEANERFFRGLRMFGTDFLMIANMFPGLSRKQIKMKFIREENADKARVLDCLRNREPVQLEEYANMANKEAEEYHTLDSLQKELDEQEKKLREEDNQRRKREGYIPTGTDDNNAGQSDPADNEGDPERQVASAEPGRFDSMAREIVGAAMAPKKRSRKTNATTGKRGPKAGRRPDGGVEEVLGSIHEVAV